MLQWRPEPIDATPPRTWTYEGSLTDTLKSAAAAAPHGTHAECRTKWSPVGVEASPFQTTTHLAFISRDIDSAGSPKRFGRSQVHWLTARHAAHSAQAFSRHMAPQLYCRN